MAPPVLGLLGQREQLGLSSDQIGRLEAISTELRERNDSLETAVREEQRSRGRPRTVRDQRRALGDALPTLGRIWSNNRRAMDQVHDVLTPEQRARVCEEERERMADRTVEDQRRDPRLRPGDGRPRTVRRMAPDSVTATPIRGWSWCAGPAAPRPQPAATSPAQPPVPAA